MNGLLASGGNSGKQQTQTSAWTLTVGLLAALALLVVPAVTSAQGRIVIQSARPASELTRPPADVSVEFLSDGRCTVAASGEGFRSKVTYKPEGKTRRGESRCAFPPVQKGMTVNLSVLMPAGAPEPGPSQPTLRWTQADGRWQGTATLTSWPDAIAVEPLDHPLLFWVSVGVALLLLAVVMGRKRSNRRRPSSARPAPVAA